MESKLIITRVFDTDLKTVWEAWTDPEHLAQWWGPKGFTSPSPKINFYEGGISIICMQGSKEVGGQAFYSAWKYKKIVPYESIQYIDTLCDKHGNKLNPATVGMPDDFPQDSLVIIGFKGLAEASTEITITKYHNMKDHMFKMAKMGIEQSLDKLAAFFKI